MVKLYLSLSSLKQLECQRINAIKVSSHDALIGLTNLIISSNALQSLQNWKFLWIRLSYRSIASSSSPKLYSLISFLLPTNSMQYHKVDFIWGHAWHTSHPPPQTHLQFVYRTPMHPCLHQLCLRCMHGGIRSY